mgnify:CR=1 FL=1
MSLNVVIKIGKLYRQSPSPWQYHDQVNWAMNDMNNLLKKKDQGDNNIETTFYKIPVIQNGDGISFKINDLETINDEDKKASLYYLNFKTSKKDAEKRYLLGDIVYSSFVNKKGETEENGNYRMAKDKKVSSFYRCEEAAKTMDDPFIQQFRNAFRENVDRIENILTSHPSVVLHFDFDGKRWIDFEGIIENIDNILINSLVVETAFEDKVSLDKYLYKTLGGPTPGFGEAARYKNRLFSRDEIISLMYAGKAAEKPTIRINSIGIIALPHSEQLSALDVVSFFERDKELSLKDQQLDEEEDKETDLLVQSDTESDSLFGAILDNSFDEKVKFDIVFTSIPGSPAGVFYDLIEISNIEKSLLININEKIRKVKQEIVTQAVYENPNFKHKPVFDVKISFLKILGDATKDKKKFQLHLLKTLPKIYTDTYYNDPVLLPAFIEKVEYNIRNSGQSFSILKYDFYFLLKTQKTDTMTQITNSQSYALGQALGTMARPFAAWRDDCPIKSFEKSYVGNLSRRISSIGEVTKLADFLNQKLTIHERAYKTEKDAFLSLVNTIKNFENERYNKHFCSLGFFESYYAPIKKENNTDNLNTENQ